MDNKKINQLKVLQEKVDIVTISGLSPKEETEYLYLKQISGEVNAENR
jgi:hypothetical protein